jgi:hypothetical protein
MKNCMLALILLALAAPGALAAEYLFDFGTEDSPLVKGFTRVSEKSNYAAVKKFGWKLARRQKLYSMSENFASNTTFLKLGPLYGDHVTGGQKYRYRDGLMTFQLDLPPGEYVAVAIMGKMLEKNATTINRPPFHYRDYEIHVNGKEVLRVERDWEVFLKNYLKITESDFLPGESIFEEYIARNFHQVRFDFKDSLELKISNVCPINALLVYPKAEAEALNTKLAELIVAERTFVDKEYQERVPEEEGLTAADFAKRANKGYAFFYRPYVETTPRTIPTAAEIGKPAGEFLSPGEKGVLTFSLRPTQTLKDVKFEVSDLANDKGAKIAAKDIELWMWRYYASPATRTGEKYAIKPQYALRYKPMDLVANVTRTFSAYFRAPADCAPGTYIGQVRMIAKGLPVGTMQLMVKVFPFKLKKEDISYGMYTTLPYSTTLRFAGMMLKEFGSERHRKLTAEITEKMFREMRDCGFNTMSVGLPWKPFTIDGAGNVVTNKNVWVYWEDTFALYQKHFGDHPLSIFGMGWSVMCNPGTAPGWASRTRDKGWEKGISKEGQENVKKIIRHFYAQVRANNWPEVIFYCSDELSNYGLRGGKIGKMISKVYREVADELKVRVCSSVNGQAEVPMYPDLDIVIPNGSLPINEVEIAKIRKAGCELWLYNIGTNRFTGGLYLVKPRPKGRLQWAFGPAHRFVSNVPSLPSLGGMHYSLILDSELKVGKRYNVEKLRQGLIDYRYYITLEQAVKDNAKSKKPGMVQAVKKAEDLLAYIVGGIKMDVKHYAKVGMWEPKTCQRIRWMLASATQEINNAK